VASLACLACVLVCYSYFGVEQNGISPESTRVMILDQSDPKQVAEELKAAAEALKGLFEGKGSETVQKLVSYLGPFGSAISLAMLFVNIFDPGQDPNKEVLDAINALSDRMDT
jgi:hypothetical protein